MMYFVRMIVTVFLYCQLIALKTTSGQPIAADQGDTSRAFNKTKGEIGHGNQTETGPAKDVPNCPTKQLEKYQYSLLDSGQIFVYADNKTFEPSEFNVTGDRLCLLKDGETKSTYNIVTCKKWMYEPEEFKILSNGSVLLYDEFLEEGTFEFDGEYLFTCVPDDGNGTNSSSADMSDQNPKEYAVLVAIGHVGTILSVIALCIHLLVFAFVRKRRNLPSYNLASLSTAFLIAYCFILIGQIPSVLGTSCVVSAVLVQYFFLAAFLWMNVIAFDVWKALRLATTKLVTSNNKRIKIRKFLLYSLYAWGIPVVVSVAAVVVDNSPYVSKKYKPGFGEDDVCWLTNESAKAIFFAIPALTLVVVNSFFFISSAYIILSNSLKSSNDQNSTAKRNFALYARLGVIMGVTWLIGVVGVLLKQQEIWFIFDLLNSLQGLFVCLLFTCSREVYFQIRSKIRGEASSKSSTYRNSFCTKSDE